MNDRSDWQPAFIKRLRALDPRDHPEKTDRATLAQLRRGLGKPAVQTLCRIGWLFDDPRLNSKDDIDTAVLVAGLFAEHSTAGGKGSLGGALRAYRDKTGADESTDRRFVHLVDSDREDLPGRLRQVVKLLKAKDVSIDWDALLTHVRNWDHDTRWVQWQWSRNYWHAAREDADVNETEVDAPTTSKQ